MEPLKIQVEVNLSAETLQALKDIAVSISSAIMTNNLNKVLSREEDIRTVGAEVITGQREVMTGLSDQKKEETPAAPEAASAEEIPGDMPDFTEVSDAELAAATRDAVARVKGQHKSPVFIRTQIFAKYGISQSTECPQEKRAELLEDLKHAGEE